MYYQSEGTLQQSLNTGVPESTIITILRVINVSIIYMACCIAVAAWDCITCWSKEWQAIWKRQWSFIKIVYLIGRYELFFGLGLSIYLWTGSWTVEQCQHLFHLIPAFVTPVALAGEWILLMRVYALSGRRRYVLCSLGFIQLGYAVICIYISIAGMKAVPIFQEKDYCVATGGPHGNIMLAYWITPMIFDGLCTALMFYYVRTYYAAKDVSGIISVFLREGMFYFVVVTLSNSINVIFSLTKIPNQSINDAFSLTMTSVMSSRLVLSLHDKQATGIYKTRDVMTTSFWTGRSGIMTGPDASGFRNKEKLEVAVSLGQFIGPTVVPISNSESVEAIEDTSISFPPIEKDESDIEVNGMTSMSKLEC